MTRRQFITLAGAGAAALALPHIGCAQAQGPRKPNVLLIFVDDLGYAGLSCQGCGDIPTPNIDSIAANGARFTDGYVTAPLCSPSRAGLLTGRYQQRFGHEHNPKGSAVNGLPLTETTLANRLKAAGYATGMVGKWHLGMQDEQNPVSRGFDEFYGFLHGAHAYLPGRQANQNDPIRRGLQPIEEPEYLTDAFAREAVAFIDRHKTDPFFLYLPFNAVHNPIEAPDEYLQRFAHIADEKRRTHAAMLSAMDDAVGAVLAKLRDSGVEQDTLIFFISDNGGPTPQTTSSNAPLRGTKAQVYEGGIRIPYLVQWKGRVPAGTVYSRPVSSLDVVPTALTAAGAEVPATGLDGVDILPFVTGTNQATPHEQLFWRMGNKRAARVGDWKLTDNGTGAFELYNLAEDIGEERNLAADKPEVLADLTASWEQWNGLNVEPLWKPEPAAAQGQGATQKARQRFRRLDANGDNQLTPDEVPNKKLFKRLDADGDGVVTAQEARKGFQAQE